MKRKFNFSIFSLKIISSLVLYTKSYVNEAECYLQKVLQFIYDFTCKWARKILLTKINIYGICLLNLLRKKFLFSDDISKSDQKPMKILKGSFFFFFFL